MIVSRARLQRSCSRSRTLVRHVLDWFHYHRRPAVGLGDRRADGRRADPARAADGAADPLDADAAAARAADEGDPEEVQGRQAEAERRADEVLQGEPHQPGRLVPADARAAAGVHLALPTRCKHFSEARRRRARISRCCTSSRTIAAKATTHWSAATCCSSSTSGSQIASTYFMSATMDKTQRTLIMVMPLVFVFVIARFPAGLVLYWVTTNLWTVGQGLITRRLVPEARRAGAQAHARGRRPRTTASGGGNGAQGRAAARRRSPPAQRPAAAQGAAQEEGRRRGAR